MRILTITILLLAAVSLTGCFSSNPEDIRAFIKPSKVNTTTSEFILQPPDEVHISCSKVTTLHDQRQRIRADGMISFEGIGEVEAAGKTPEQLAEDIRIKAIEYYQLPEDYPVNVIVSSPQSKVYYVFGQVHSPGPRVYTGRDSVLTAISLAQPNPMAWIERIQIIRPSEDENQRPAIFEINLDRLIAHGDATKNVLLQEGDIIYVPPTVLAWMALKVEEFVRPLARAFSGVYTINRGIDSDRRYY